VAKSWKERFGKSSHPIPSRNVSLVCGVLSSVRRWTPRWSVASTIRRRTCTSSTHDWESNSSACSKAYRNLSPRFLLWRYHVYLSDFVKRF